MTSPATNTQDAQVPHHVKILLAKALVSPVKGLVQFGNSLVNLGKLKWGRSFKNITEDTQTNHELYPTKAKIRKALWKEAGEGALNVFIPFLSTIVLDVLSKDDTKKFKNKVRELEEDIEDRTCAHEVIVAWTVYGKGARPTEIKEAMNELLNTQQSSEQLDPIPSNLSESTHLESKELPKENDSKNNYIEKVSEDSQVPKEQKLPDTAKAPSRSQSDGVLVKQESSV